MVRWNSLVAAVSLSLLASAAVAQSSFSSVSEMKGKTLQPEYSGKFYSEDGRNFRLRVYGCEFDVFDDDRGGSMTEQVLRETRKHMRGREVQKMPEGTVTFERSVALIGARRVNYSTRMPADFRCDSSQTVTMLSIARYDFRDPAIASVYDSRIAVIIFQFPYIDGNLGESSPPRLIFLRPDLFTPRQEEEAWRIGGEVGLALFKALIQPKR